MNFPTPHSPLFTFIMEFRGGTYVSQVQSPDVAAAVKAWAWALDVAAVEGLTKELKRQMIEDLPDEAPVAVEGARNVWFFSAQIGRYYGHVNVVLTEEGGELG